MSGVGILGVDILRLTLCNGVRTNIYNKINFIKLPKKWSGQNWTSWTGSYAYVHVPVDLCEVGFSSSCSL